MPRAPRRIQRIAWAVSCSPVGNLFFRRLRGKQGERIRSFTDKNLFAGESDDVWVKHVAAYFESRHASTDFHATTPPPRRQCYESARDARGRFATLSYLCGTIPSGGSWRDERGGLLADLTVPTSIFRGDFPGARDPVNRTREALQRLPFPAGGYIVRDARACLPWEQPEQTASALLSFLKAPKKDRGVQYVGT